MNYLDCKENYRIERIRRNEKWKDVINYEGYYQISDSGRVKSLERFVPHKKYVKMRVKESILINNLNTNGYYYVILRKDNKSKSKNIHQLVAESFLNHKANYYSEVINHKDFNKRNNNLNNLEIVSQRQNTNKKNLKSSSKYTGVSFNKVSEKWKSTIFINGRNIHLGFFEKEIQAHETYQKVLKRIFLGIYNMPNKKEYSSKYKGVCFCKTHKKWKSAITENNKKKNLGYFKTEIEAYESILKYKKHQL